MMQTSAAVARVPPQPSPLAGALVTREVTDTLLRIALHKMKDATQAEDLMQDTVETALGRDGGESAWKGDPPPVLWFLGSVMNGVLSNRRRKAKVRPRQVEGEPEDLASESLNAEEAMADREGDEEARQVMAELRAYFGDDAKGAVPLAILDAADSGVHGARNVAGHARCPVEDVYRANDRIKQQLTRITERRARKGPTS